MKITLVFVIQLFLAGLILHADGDAPQPTKGPVPENQAWGPESNGFRLALQAKETEVEAKSRVEFTVILKNVSQSTNTVHLLQPQYDYAVTIRTGKEETHLPPQQLIKVYWQDRKVFLPGEEVGLPFSIRLVALGTNTIMVTRRIPRLSGGGDAELTSNLVTILVAESEATKLDR